MFNGARVLVAPLDWGLGHATRDVPIIRRLLDLGARPVIGADHGPLALLRDEFPDLPWVRIPGAHVRYAKGRSQFWSMARQFPALVASVRREQALIQRMKAEWALDAVISDQRFGIRSDGSPSVLITHQVFPLLPFAQRMLRGTNLRYIARFDSCWIMDEEEAPGLAGTLSHGRALPPNARYIGIHSRMATEQPATRRYRIVAVISGPEPQRTMLEGILLHRLHAIEGEHLLVRGQPGHAAPPASGNVRVVPHLGAAELAAAMASAELIVSRSGYTTLMDLCALGRSAVIIPTPGQPEQEHLARLHERTGRFLVQAQDRIDLQAALRSAAAARAHDARSDASGLERALHELATLIHA